VLDALLEEARDDENVVGVVVFGSRGKGAFVTEQSDWDVFVVVRELRGERAFRHGDRVETIEVTLDGLRNPPAWNRYSLTWIEPQLDKTGEVAAALEEALRVDPASAAEPLDGYVNSYYRSAKNSAIGLELAALLDAQESIGWLLEFVFAAHGRLRPFNKWLAWELEQHPLPEPRCSLQLGASELLPRLELIGRTGDLAAQKALFRDVEAFARECGLGATIDAWEPDGPRLRGDV
jgi:predicted nucleotidyltransferase